MARRRHIECARAGVRVPLRCSPSRICGRVDGARCCAAATRWSKRCCPVSMSNEGLEERDGIEAKTVILDQLAQALKVIAQHDPARITTLGGECSVSVAPFAALLTDTATTSRSCGLTPIPTSAPASANIPGTTRWPSPRSLVEPILRCKPSYRRPFRRTGWRLSACTRGPTMITPTSLPGGSHPSAPTTYESRVSGCWISWLEQAARASPFTLTSTPSTATRSCWASAPNPTGRRVSRCNGSSTTLAGQ